MTLNMIRIHGAEAADRGETYCNNPYPPLSTEGKAWLEANQAAWLNKVAHYLIPRSKT
jgi:hypothetical protein